jgi:large subunit ribosomal protein L4e
MAEEENKEPKKVEKSPEPTVKKVVKKEGAPPLKKPGAKKKPVKGKTRKPHPGKKKVRGKPKKIERVNLYSIDGKAKGKIELPKVFFEDVRVDLIRRAHSASQANRRQAYGPSSVSGMSHSTSTWGKGRGVARVQRLSQGRTAVESPGNVGGRRAHPPRPIKDWSKKINKKERRHARNSALSATKDMDMVAARGHRFDDSITLPLIVEDTIEKIKTVREAINTLEKLGVKDDLMRAKSGIHIRAGRGKMRGRRYRKPKSLLIVVKDHDKVKRGFGNLSGVDVTTPEHMNIELLAPGGIPGRLTLISKGALKQLEKW